MTNIASYTFDGDTLSSEPTAPLTLAEPQVTLTKNVTAPASISAGTVLDYTVELSAGHRCQCRRCPGPGAHRYPWTRAWSMKPVAPTSATRTPSAVTASTLRRCSPGTSATCPKGRPIPSPIRVTVQDTVSAGQTLNNSAEARWTSLAGDSDYRA